MAIEQFSEDEQFLLMSIPSMIGSAVSMSESSGIIGTVKEAMANAKSIISAVESYPNNQLIQSVLPVLEERQEAIQHAKDFKDKAIARMKQKGIKSKQMFKLQLLEDCRTVAKLLNEKVSDQEKHEYKEWSMKVAEQVAMAAKEGGFLGFGGQQISKGEVEMIQEIADALETESPFALL